MWTLRRIRTHRLLREFECKQAGTDHTRSKLRDRRNDGRQHQQPIAAPERQPHTTAFLTTVRSLVAQTRVEYLSRTPSAT